MTARLKEIPPPGEFDGAAYARDLLALRAHSKLIASYLSQAGVPEHNIRSVLVSITEAGMHDAHRVVP